MGSKWTPTLIFADVRDGKTKRNRWVERPSKMRSLHRCHCLQKFSKYEQTTKEYQLRSNGPPPPPPPHPRPPFSSVSTGLYKKIHISKFSDIACLETCLFMSQTEHIEKLSKIFSTLKHCGDNHRYNTRSAIKKHLNILHLILSLMVHNHSNNSITD